MMQKGGTMSNLNMGPEQGKALTTLCQLVAKHEVAPLVSRMEAAVAKKKKGRRKRLADLKMREELCQGIFGTCNLILSYRCELLEEVGTRFSHAAPGL